MTSSADGQVALQAEHALGRRIEDHDVVRALVVGADRIGQAPAAPGAHLDELAARAGDGPGGAIEDRLAPVVGQIRAQDEHEFVTAHGPWASFPWGWLGST